MGKFNFKDEQDFMAIKEKAEIFYKTIGEVYCPYFHEKISFNAKGLRHLKFKSDQQPMEAPFKTSYVLRIHCCAG